MAFTIKPDTQELVTSMAQQLNMQAKQQTVLEEQLYNAHNQLEKISEILEKKNNLLVDKERTISTLKEALAGVSKLKQPPVNQEYNLWINRGVPGFCHA